MKKIKEIYNKIYKALKTLYIFNIGNNFKKKKERKEYLIAIGDWYYQHSWFERKWFLHKLKRKIMGFIYRIGERIDDLLCDKYFYEFVFGDMFCEAKLPIIFYTHDFENVRIAIGLINGDLVEKFGFTLLPTNNVIKLKNENLDEFKNIVRSNVIRNYAGSINLATRFGKTKKSTIIDFLNVDENDVLLGEYVETTTKIDFTKITDRKNHLLQLSNSTIYITIINNELCNQAINRGIGPVDRLKELIKGLEK